MYWLKKKKAWSPRTISQQEVVGCYSDWTEEPSLQGLTNGMCCTSQLITQILSGSLPSCVALSPLLNFSVSHFAYLQNRNKDPTDGLDVRTQAVNMSEMAS